MRFYALAERPWIEEEDGAGYWGLPDGAIGSVDLAPLGSQSFVFVTSDQPISGEAVFGDGTRLHQHSLTPAERTAWTGLTGVALPSDVTLLDALWHTLTAAADPDGGERAKPIMPTHRGRLELHLGGHSLVRAEQMPADPTQHPAWPKIQAVLQNDYREIHDGPALKGLARQRQSGNPTLARKYLGAMAQKYRLPGEAASNLLIPRDLPRVSALKPTTELGDTFDAPDGTELDDHIATGPHGGWGWSMVSGGRYKIHSGRLVGPSSNNHHYHVASKPLSSDDLRSEIEAYTDLAISPAARSSTSEVTFYLAKSRRSIDIVRFQDKKETNLTSVGVSFDDGDVISIDADGSSISVFKNNSLVLGPVTDTVITGLPNCGIWSWNGSGEGDNFYASDLLAPPVEITGDLDAVEPAPDAATVRGSVAITGEIVARERGGDGAQIRGSAVAAANMAATETGQDSAALTGSAVIAASLDAHEAGPDAATLRGAVDVTGAIDAVEPASDTVEIVEGESGEITGTLAAIEPGGDTAAATGTVAITGAMAAREAGGDGATMRTSVAISGALAASEAGADALDAAGATIITGALGALDPGPDSTEIAGNITISASLHAVELGGDTAEFLEVPPPLPDVQVTVPGVWQRRMAQGFWRRAS